MRGKLIAVILATATLSGCIAMQRAKQHEAFESAQRYCLSLYADPVLDPIRGKVALDNLQNQTFAMRTNTSHATEQEKPALAAWMDKRKACRDNLNKSVSLPAQAAAVINAARQASDALTAQLYLGQITYGDFANRRAELGAEMQTALANIDNALRIQNQQAAFRAQSLANQAIANWNAQMQTQAVQQMQMQMSQPHTFNCQTFGIMTQCQ